MTVSLLRFRFALFTLALGPALAGAEPVSLEPVTITGTRTAATSEELPTGTVILEREDIEKMPATNLADVIDTVGGVNVRRLYGVDGSRTRIDFLGFGATGNQNTLVLLNGHRYSNVDLTGPELGSLPVSAIERIEILPAAGAALYGNGAVGGVVNIITRQHYDNEAGASLSHGDFNTTGGEVHGSWSSGNFNTVASVDALNSEGYRDNNDLQRRNGFLDLRHHTDTGTFFMTVTAEDQQLGLPGSRNADFSSDDTEFENDPQGTDSPRDEASQESLTITPGAIIPLNDMVSFRLDISGRDKEQQSFYEGFGAFSHGRNDVTTRSASPRFKLTPETGALKHDLTLGWDYYDYDYESRFAASEDQLSNPAHSKKIDQKQKSWYAHDLIHIGDAWALTAGARTLDVETKSRGTGFYAGNSDARQEGELYEGGIRYHFTPSFSGFAGAQRSVRIENADEISTGGTGDLEPQTGRTYTLGATWKKQHQHSTLTLWRGRFENEIIFDPNGGPFGFGANTNLQDPTLRKGASLNSRWRLEDKLFLSINGSYQRATFQGGQYEGNEVPLVPLQTASFQADYDILDWLRISLAHRYVGKRYLEDDTANELRRLPSYRMSDAIVRADWGKGFVEVGAYNFTDELAADYGIKTPFGPTDYAAYPLPERHYLATLGVKL